VCRGGRAPDGLESRLAKKCYMSSPGPSHSTPQSLPPIVLNLIRDRYLAGVATAQAQYQNAAGDEDSLSGALGALISTSEPVHFLFGSSLDIEVQIDFRKLRGRGQNAPRRGSGRTESFNYRF
jgi:hypothetical protein